MIKYTGVAETREVRVKREGKTYPLNPRNDIINHSPDGFNWGYGGSGPSQLALAILADYLGPGPSERDAVLLYQDFKWEVVAKINGDENFEISEEQMQNALRKITEQP